MPRSWGLGGTSNNEDEFLSDPTGNSRHLPIIVGWDFDKGETIPIEWFEQEIREPLLAELIYLVEEAKEPNWLDHEQSLAHKEYVNKFEMKNGALYSIEHALHGAFTQSGLGETVLDYPGIHFDELYRHLQLTERNAHLQRRLSRKG